MAGDLYDVADPAVRTRSLGHSLLVVASAFVAGAALYGGISDALAAVGHGVAAESPRATLLSSIFQYLGFLAVAVAYLVAVDDRDLVDLRVPSLRDLGWIAGGLLVLLGASRAISWIVAAAGVESAQNQVVAQGQQHPALFLAMIPITLVFVGPAEELVFRGVVQGLFERAYGTVPAVLLASALFGVAHYLALVGAGKVTYLAVAGTLGLILGTLYALSENLVVPAVVHGLFNSTVFVGQWLASGGSIPGPL